VQRRFADLADSLLVEEFWRVRTVEMRQMVFLVSGFAAFGLAFLWLRYRPAA
jgi:hypothetical protein